MKYQFAKSLFFILLSVFLFSCVKPPVVAELVQAEKLMSDYPDSTLQILYSIQEPVKMAEANYADYCLLLTEAQDKTYYKFTSDSVIRIALDYYEATENKAKLPKVYYYMGRVCHTLRNAPQAISYYLKAKNALPKDTDYALEARIYNQLGGLYVTLGFNENAASAYQEAYRLLSLAGDSVNLPYMLRNLARTNEASEKKDSAVYYYNKAIISAMEADNSVCEISSRMELVSIYLKENKLAEAEKHIEKAIDLYSDRKFHPQTELILGKYLNATEQLDSARYYFNKSKDSTNLYTHAASIRELGLLEEKLQNYKQAVEYFHQYNTCKDSIEKLMDKTAVADMEHFYNYQQVENENNRIKIEYRQEQLLHSRLYFSIAIVLILIVAYFFYYRQKKKKEMLLKEKDLLYKDEQYRKSRNKIEGNLHEIQVLKDALEKSSGQLDQLSQKLIMTKKEFLEQENKQIELSIHHVNLQRQKLILSPVYKEVKELASDKILPQSVWLQFKAEIDSIYNVFEDKLRLLHPTMSEIEIKVCYLLKTEFNVSEIAILLGRAKPTITSCRKRLYEKISGISGSAEELDRIIMNLD